MAGVQLGALAAAVTGAGGLGAVPCAMLTPAQILAEVAAIAGPSNLRADQRRARTRPDAAPCPPRT